MADFLIAARKTDAFEGDYTGHPDDNGNWTGGKKGVGVLVGTKYGVSAPLLAQYLGRTPTVQDMKNLTRETQRLLFRKLYWNVIRGDEIVHQGIANLIYDRAINFGPGKAIRMAQSSLKLQQTGLMTNSLLNLLNNK